MKKGHNTSFDAPAVSTNNAASYFAVGSSNFNSRNNNNTVVNGVQPPSQPSSFGAPPRADAPLIPPPGQPSNYSNNSHAPINTAPLRSVGAATPTLRPVIVSYNRAMATSTPSSGSANFPIRPPVAGSLYPPVVAAASRTPSTVQPSAVNFFGAAAERDFPTDRTDSNVVSTESISSAHQKRDNVATSFQATSFQSNVKPPSAVHFFTAPEVATQQNQQPSPMVSHQMTTSTHHVRNNAASHHPEILHSAAKNVSGAASQNVTKHILVTPSQKTSESTTSFHEKALLPPRNIYGISKVAREELISTRIGMTMDNDDTSTGTKSQPSAKDIYFEVSSTFSHPMSGNASQPPASNFFSYNEVVTADSSATNTEKIAQNVDADDEISSLAAAAVEEPQISKSLASAKSELISTDDDNKPSLGSESTSGDITAKISTPFTASKKLSYKLPNLPLPPPTPPPGSLKSLLHVALAPEVENRSISNSSPCFRVPPPLDLSKVVAAPASGNSSRRKLSFTRHSAPSPSPGNYRKDSFSVTSTMNTSTLGVKSFEAASGKVSDSPTPSLNSYDTVASKSLSILSAQMLVPSMKVEASITPVTGGTRPATTVESDAALSRAVVVAVRETAEESVGRDEQLQDSLSMSPRASAVTVSEANFAQLPNHFDSTLHAEMSAQREVNPEAEIPPIVKEAQQSISENHTEVLEEASVEVNTSLERLDRTEDPFVSTNSISPFLLQPTESRENNHASHLGQKLKAPSPVASVHTNFATVLPEVYPRQHATLRSSTESYCETLRALNFHDSPKLEPESDHPKQDLFPKETLTSASVPTSQTLSVPPPSSGRLVGKDENLPIHRETSLISDRNKGLNTFQREQPSTDNEVLQCETEEIALDKKIKCEEFGLEKTWDISEDYTTRKLHEDREHLAVDHLLSEHESKTLTNIPPADSVTDLASPFKAVVSGSFEPLHEVLEKDFQPTGLSSSKLMHTVNGRVEDSPETNENASSTLSYTMLLNGTEEEAVGKAVEAVEGVIHSVYSPRHVIGSLNGNLPAGWVEAVHPETNHLYYFNQELNIAQWERPDVATGSKASIVQEEGLYRKNSDLFSDSEQINEKAPSTIRSAVVMEPKEGVAADDIFSNSTLPPGWVELIHAETNNVYYYNSELNVSQWERPNQDPGKKGDFLPVDDVPITNEAMVGANDAEKTREEVKLFEDEGLNKVDVSEGYDKVDDDSINNMTKDPLPAGWVELRHPDAEEPYYHNARLNISQWERPSMTEHATDLSHHLETFLQETNHEASENSKVKVDQTVIDAIVADAVADAAALVDEVSFKNQAMVGAGDFEKTKEDAVVFGAEDLNKIDGAEWHERIDDDAINNMTRAPLPAGWVELRHPEAEEPYYYNAELNISQWERPSTTKSATDLSHHLEANHETSEISGAKLDQTVVDAIADTANNKLSAELLEDDMVSLKNSPLDEYVIQPVKTSLTTCPSSSWVELVSEDGKVYYYNEELNISQWERPNIVATDKTLEADAALESSERVGLGHEEENIIGADAISDETTGSEVPLSPAQKVTQVGETSEVQSAEVSDETALKLKASLYNGTLPAGWVEVKHPETQQIFYYNQEFDVSQWEFPISSKVRHEDDPFMEVVNQSSTPLEVDYITNELIKSQGLREPSPVPDDSVASQVHTAEKIPEARIEIDQNEDSGGRSTSDVVDTPLVAQSLSSSAVCDLPPGWIEVTHPDTNQVYYYNEIQNIAQWEKPFEGLLERPIVEKNVEIKATNISSKAVENVADTGAEGVVAIPDGWIELKDPATLKSYYYCESTGETCWNLPVPRGHDASEDCHLESLQKGQEDNILKETKRCTVHGELRQDASIAKKLSKVTGSQTSHQINGVRRVHALASFGFGGRLCIMRPEPAKRLAPITVGPDKQESSAPISWRKGPLQVRRLCHFLSPCVLSLPCPSRDDFIGPWNASSEETAWGHLRLRCSSEQHENGILWRLIMVAALSKGQLRSNEGFKNANGPEAGIVSILVGEKKSVMKEINLPLMRSSYASPSSDSLSRIQSLLLYGERNVAVEEALSGNHYALALLIASMCDKKTFQHAASRFTEEVISPGTPLHTLTALFSGALELGKTQDNSRLTPRQFWGSADSQKLISSWQHHLATIISNRTTGWEKLVRALGDQLWINRDIRAAHFCYMVCGCQISLPSPNTRITLVGCDCSLPVNVGLMTHEAIQSYERTEAFEWAKRRGNPSAAIPALQPFKLKYAKLLADFGWEAQALSYLDSIRLCTGLTVTSKADGVYSTEFIEDLNAFEDRVCVSLRTEIPKQISRSSWSTVDKVSSTIKSVSSVLTKPRKAPAAEEQLSRGKLPTSSRFQQDKKQNSLAVDGLDLVSSKAVDDVPKVFSNAPLKSSEVSSTEKQSVEVEPPLIAPAKDEKNKITTTENKSHLRLFPSNVVALNPTSGDIDAAPLASNSFDADNGEELKISSTKTEYVTDIFLDQKEGEEAEVNSPPGGSLESSSMPRKQIEQGQKIKKTMSWLGNSTSKPMDAPRSSGAQIETPPKAKHMTVKPAPKSEGAMIDNKQGVSSDKSKTPWGGLRTWVTKKLNPDATEADLGGKMEAYYDKKLGRWIFPGDDPNEVAKPLAPPPVKPADVVKEEKKEEITKSDPLAALMAPPPSRTTTNRAPLSVNRRADLKVTPSMMPKLDPLKTAVEPPKFTVFQPVSNQ